MQVKESRLRFPDVFIVTGPGIAVPPHAAKHVRKADSDLHGRASTENAHGQSAATEQALTAEMERPREPEIDAALVSMVSNELRSPLTAIVSAAKIITAYHDSRPEIVERFAEAIAAEGERVIKLVADYLELADMRSGCDKWVESDVEPGALLEQLLWDVEPRARARGIQLVEAIEPNLPTLHVHAARLAAVLADLVGAALERTRKGDCVTLRAELSGAAIMFGIDDTGRGFLPHELATVFDRNPRLCILRELVRHYRGRISTESDANGSTFTFTVALSQTPA